MERTSIEDIVDSFITLYWSNENSWLFYLCIFILVKNWFCEIKNQEFSLLQYGKNNSYLFSVVSCIGFPQSVWQSP